MVRRSYPSRDQSLTAFAARFNFGRHKITATPAGKPPCIYLRLGRSALGVADDVDSSGIVMSILGPDVILARFIWRKALRPSRLLNWLQAGWARGMFAAGCLDVSQARQL
ncbi:hypothetical protein BN77_1480 [Rhizobium mesoamericanum STM3625]|uniref:Uncharacterized protein n=1 Tax=Rhizobium mesoamericanum STM3625 TaxID=1211777 RepID=K0PT84_9HYPH|nr:hypothetical protein BN77_1480 [Rhizobium mesoamericanum STM3625]